VAFFGLRQGFYPNRPRSACLAFFFSVTKHTEAIQVLHIRQETDTFFPADAAQKWATRYSQKRQNIPSPQKLAV